MVVEGLMSGRFLTALAREQLRGKRLLFDTPLKLLLAGEINHTFLAVGEIEKNLEIGVQKPANVIAVTVNPYYPKYDYSSRDYEAAFVDKTALLEAVGTSVNLPCYDIVADGGSGLLRDVLRDGF
jgi:hypothetical protein